MTKRTASQLVKEIEKSKQHLAGLEAALNEESLKEVNVCIDKLTTALAITMLDNNELDLKAVTQRLKKLLNATCGKDHEVKIEKKPIPGTFDWKTLVAKMKTNNVDKKNPASRKELEELYFNGNNVIFNQRFNSKEEREKHLKSEGTAKNKKYWV